ncbi:hypothetical protein KIN20_016769 [Parelaphostrongylus tenuis]|uniref:Uncharacterized protein n=1 Tax=Parelaphostrongylus tenuis TaxID=148309 RepID=A0AAD5MHT5_PARTN|nr:hypothetical protein KIN20_016769 [Parelaphostrongylus tenuis]
MTMFGFNTLQFPPTVGVAKQKCDTNGPDDNIRAARLNPLANRSRSTRQCDVCGLHGFVFIQNEVLRKGKLSNS